MKKLLALLILATLGRADVVGPLPVQLPAEGGVWPLSGSVTYALNNALTGVASTAIDLSGNNGVYMTLTGSANGLVSIYFSNANVAPGTGAIPAYQVQVPGNYYVPMKARYMSLMNDTQKATTKITAFYYLASPSITATVATPTPGTQGVSVTSSVALNVSVTSNTSGYSPTGTTVYSALSSVATVVNLSSSAGVNAPILFCATSNGGAAAGFKVQFGTSASAPANLTSSSVGHYIAASTTSQCWGPFAPGTIAYIAGVAATSYVIVDLQQAK